MIIGGEGMSKLYEVELNSAGAPDFSTAKEVPQLDDVRKEAYKHGKSKGIKKGRAMAQPQRMKGKWERKESDLSWWYECSKCGESPLFDPYEHEVRTPFCPWCGTEMWR